jgi:cytochrome c oxidase subunit IV
MLRSYTETAITVTSALVSSVSRFALQVGVSLVLAFMVVWDVDAIAAGVRSLENSRLAAVYAEVAPPLSVFGQLFGKALQAQARIALVNTGLTAAGMAALAIPGAGLLSLFVFLCSFIPIAGCFISTVPIAFVALTEYGFIKLALVVLMVTCIHIIEAYGLNPAIYSAHLKLHPLLVLAVLVVAEHSLGVWGLLLAVPATVFVLDYAIRYPACSVVGVAARELQTMEESDSEGDGGGSDGGGGGGSGSGSGSGKKTGGEGGGGGGTRARKGGGGGGGEGGTGGEGSGGGDGPGGDDHGGWTPPRPTLGDLRAGPR